MPIRLNKKKESPKVDPKTDKSSTNINCIKPEDLVISEKNFEKLLETIENKLDKIMSIIDKK